MTKNKIKSLTEIGPRIGIGSEVNSNGGEPLDARRFRRQGQIQTVACYGVQCLRDWNYLHFQSTSRNLDWLADQHQRELEYSNSDETLDLGHEGDTRLARLIHQTRARRDDPGEYIPGSSLCFAQHSRRLPPALGCFPPLSHLPSATTLNGSTSFKHESSFNELFCQDQQVLYLH